MVALSWHRLFFVNVQRVGAPFGVAVIAVILQSLLDGATTAADGLAAFSGTFWRTFGLGRARRGTTSGRAGT